MNSNMCTTIIKELKMYRPNIPLQIYMIEHNRNRLFQSWIRTRDGFSISLITKDIVFTISYTQGSRYLSIRGYTYIINKMILENEISEFQKFTVYHFEIFRLSADLSKIHYVPTFAVKENKLRCDAKL